VSRKYPKCEFCDVKDVEYHGAFCSTSCQMKYIDRQQEQEREQKKTDDIEWLIENRAKLEEMLEWYETHNMRGTLP
jgi:hypothetical protein